MIVCQRVKSCDVSFSEMGCVTCQCNGCVSGSGRVTFSSYKSYVKAVSAAFVEIKTAKFTKKVRLGRLAHHFVSQRADLKLWFA